MVPAGLAANWLAAAWNQNVSLRAMSPIAAELEEIVLRWVCEALGLPPDCAGGLVTCATMANFTALLTARQALLARAGSEAAAHGMFGAPPIEGVDCAAVPAATLNALTMPAFRHNTLTILEHD